MINLINHFKAIVVANGAVEVAEQNEQFAALIEEQYQCGGLERKEYNALVNVQPFEA